MVTRRLSTEIQSTQSIMIGNRHFGIKGVIFDMDGTLTVPVFDFTKLKIKLGLSPKDDVLEAVGKMEGLQKASAQRMIEEFEDEGLRNFQLQPNIVQLLEFINSCGIKLALVTRNSQKGVDFFMERLKKEIDAVSTPTSKQLPWPVFSQVISDILIYNNTI